MPCRQGNFREVLRLIFPLNATAFESCEVTFKTITHHLQVPGHRLVLRGPNWRNALL